MGFQVTFRSEACKGCGLCIAACPKQLLAEDRRALNQNGVYPAAITDRGACVGCLSCALMCPDAVITVETLEN